MRISDWSSDVCSSDLDALGHGVAAQDAAAVDVHQDGVDRRVAQQQLEAVGDLRAGRLRAHVHEVGRLAALLLQQVDGGQREAGAVHHDADVAVEMDVVRSEEHTSELQSLMRISYAVFCLKKKIQTLNTT